MAIAKPRALRTGDKIAITAPSMHIVDEEAVRRGVDRLQGLGFRVQMGATVRSKYRNTTAPPEERAQEIADFFADPEVGAIVCLIGGDTAPQLLRLLDYKTIGENPKIFTGMSDICHLHLAFLSRANVMSLHGPDLTFGFGGDSDDAATRYNIDLFMKCCTQKEALGVLPAHTQWECWRPGRAQGRLVGGFLGAVTGLYGTRYWPSFERVILFWEAAWMQPHLIERELTIAEADGFFDNVAGMVIGKLVDCEEREYAGLLPGVREIVLEITKRHGFPIVANADFGHDLTNMPLPEGLLAGMDAEDLSLELMEPMVL
ncbi:MAG: LD-carboxypeptidase [Dehalococcoidales bacterium]